MIKKAEEMKDADAKKREEIETKNYLDTHIY